MPDADDAMVATVALQVATIVRQSGFDRTCEMGRTILAGFYGGSEALWSARSRGKLSSIRKLARCLKGVVRATELHRSVHVWLVCQDLPFVPTSEHLTVSHVDAVLGLPRERQAELLRQAQGHSLSVRELRGLRRRLKIAAGEARGRPPSPIAVKAHTRIRQALNALELAERAAEDAYDGSKPFPAEVLEQLERIRDGAARLVALARCDRPSGVTLKPLSPANARVDASRFGATG